MLTSIIFVNCASILAAVFNVTDAKGQSLSVALWINVCVKNPDISV